MKVPVKKETLKHKAKPQHHRTYALESRMESKRETLDRKSNKRVIDTTAMAFDTSAGIEMKGTQRWKTKIRPWQKEMEEQKNPRGENWPAKKITRRNGTKQLW